MAKKSDLPGYIKGEDFVRDGVWCQFTFTITAVHAPGSVKCEDGTTIDGPVIEFKETPLRWIPSKGCRRRLKVALGDSNTAKWIGKAVTLHPAMGKGRDWFGEEGIVGIRVRYPKNIVARVKENPKHAGIDLTGNPQFKKE